MAYTTINKSTDYFNTKLYTGNSGTQAITGVGHQPDLVWIKNRNDTNNQSHVLYDAVRGVTKYISSNSTAVEGTETAGVTAFGTDGFTVGNTVTVNTGFNYVAWNWKANGTGSSNSNGSITSTVSANTTSGFSIVKYTGTGANATVGHGLGVAPKMILVKKISGSADDWLVYHSGMGATKYMKLNNTVAGTTASVAWNDTAPTTTVFSLGSSSVPNANGEDYIAYCFADKTGYSKFASYQGNGNADGAFVYTGFAVKFLMVKEYGATGNWLMWDSTNRNWNRTYKMANSSDVENSADNVSIDLLSNGFKFRGNAGDSNGSGNSILYMAFGQSLVGSNNVPCTAR
tara:strand:- start:27 stop:1058 length:1032 start_codon:yes stop_codon:yes gene_type:complete